MKAAMIPATAMALGMLVGVACAESTVISPNGSRPSSKGPEANFTGSVTVDPLYAPNETTSNSGAVVTFEPGARSAWHSHPAGQALIVVAGTGWVQEENGVKREIRPGDVVWTPPGVKHWHGATDATSMSHIAVTNVLDGRNADWREKVNDAIYSGD